MSFHTIASTTNVGNCSVCLLDFKLGDLISAHRHTSCAENIHKIHSACLDLLLADPETFQCPECRLQITSINGTAVQRLPYFPRVIPIIQQDPEALQIADGGATNNFANLLALNAAAGDWLELDDHPIDNGVVAAALA